MILVIVDVAQRHIVTVHCEGATQKISVLGDKRWWRYIDGYYVPLLLLQTLLGCCRCG